MYQYLPIEVPTGAASLRVRLSYERGGAVLDLGCFGADGFRGWSGGARDHFSIGPDRATPGYLPGPVEPGIWSVVLGLHRVPSAGVPWEVTWEVTDTVSDARPPDPAPERQRPPRPGHDIPASPGLRWLAGDLHAHTEHSDGVLSVAELAHLAAGRGLDFLAVTDHNTTSHHAELPAAAAASGVLLLPGQEVTTDRGHANVFGDVGWVDFRRPAETWLAHASERGGLLSINHPVGGDCAWRHRMPTPPLAEVWHSSWRDRRDGAALAWWEAHRLTPAPIGGSDWHRPGSDALVGTPTTWVACEDDDVLGGLAAGRTAVNLGPGEPLLVRVDGELLALDADASTLTCPDGGQTRIHGDRRTLGDHTGPHMLVDDTAATLAITA